TIACQLSDFILLLLLLNVAVGFKFSIVHTNDMHARYDPIKSANAKCGKGEDEKGQCFGGFARVATAVERARAKGQVIYLDAGDTFQGTPWYSIYKGELAAELLNMLNPDAVALGNHEFDDGVEGLLPFIQKVKFPVVCANIDLRKVPQMQKLKNLVKSTVINKWGEKIGIIGYLTPETKTMVTPNDVEYEEEITAINAEAKKLNYSGVDIIIALGHSGYDMDMEIAKSCPQVDVVVGGHSHTFLYKGDPPSTEKAAGLYPTVVTRSNGRQVPVVQAYAYTKYLGRIDLEFDKSGHLTSFDGNPQLLDSSVPHNPEIKKLLDAKRKPIDELDKQVVGTTKTTLDGDWKRCRKEECTMGNVIADAFVYARVLEDFGGIYWTDAAVAFINAGGIRASINKTSDGSISAADIHAVMLFGNKLQVTEILGLQLLQSLEHAATVRGFYQNSGGFLQMSGVRVTLDYNKPKKKRVTSVEVLCSACDPPEFRQLEKQKSYKVIVSNYNLEGGDGHNFKDPDKPKVSTMQLTDRDALIQYFQQHKVVFPALEGRITVINKKRSSSHAAPTQLPNSRTFMVIILFYFFTRPIINV
ncbi:CG30103, partial [Drosophila busckii]